MSPRIRQRPCISLSEYFTDVEDDATELIYEVVGNTNPDLVAASVDGFELSLSYGRDAYGIAELTVRATDSSGAFVEDVLAVNVQPVNDAPEIGVLLDGPDPAIVGADLTLQVDSLVDDSLATTVDFYRDADEDGLLDPAVDQLARFRYRWFRRLVDYGLYRRLWAWGAAVFCASDRRRGTHQPDRHGHRQRGHFWRD
jgi:hypothetical protein